MIEKIICANCDWADSTDELSAYDDIVVGEKALEIWNERIGPNEILMKYADVEEFFPVTERGS